ncbi:hypothetical protein NAEGRDRAFT_78867 [Naegleria gruberi]|uniref:F-box domain-containing protein n=1 Tax=Naegleria gruberi TaxID=5762 RepID=D2V785_NAEGR|nr:uncharacterized protein NAEGRDRAFT_78867 [Naegleria gruberi]EFC47214.1 hypothetical protein NAEGRDRAFT_78867 [Naegleria gruberi]|eukprot:XP_002679958.1 hypothetical protein NAEGRDRAFT_78867 [Naegleria gruberi strain NEG-M]
MTEHDHHEEENKHATSLPTGSIELDEVITTISTTNNQLQQTSNNHSENSSSNHSSTTSTTTRNHPNLPEIIIPKNEDIIVAISKHHTSPNSHHIPNNNTSTDIVFEDNGESNTSFMNTEDDIISDSTQEENLYDDIVLSNPTQPNSARSNSNNSTATTTSSNQPSPLQQLNIQPHHQIQDGRVSPSANPYPTSSNSSIKQQHSVITTPSPPSIPFSSAATRHHVNNNTPTSSLHKHTTTTPTVNISRHYSGTSNKSDIISIESSYSETSSYKAKRHRERNIQYQTNTVSERSNNSHRQSKLPPSLISDFTPNRNSLVRFQEDNIIDNNLHHQISKRLTSSPRAEDDQRMIASNFFTNASVPNLLSIGSNIFFSGNKTSTVTSNNVDKYKDTTNVLSLPDNIMLHIFSFVGIQYAEDNNYNMLCKRWYVLLCLDYLWKERYFNFFNSRSIQANPMLLSYSKDFDFPQRSKFRYNLILLRKKKHLLKQRLLSQNRHEKSRRYFLFNSFVLNPLVAIICFMISTVVFGLQEDGVIPKNDRNTLLFVFLPFFTSFLFSIVGNVSLGLRETIFCKNGFYDISHFIHFLVIVLGQYTFYFCSLLFGLKWFWFKTSLWTSFSIPCLCIYIMFVGFCFAYILHKYVKRRIQFQDMRKDRPNLSVNSPEYFYFAYRLRSHKRREFYSKAKYIAQPYDDDFIELSEDEDMGNDTDEDLEDTFDDSTAFDDETETTSRKTDEMVSTPKTRERKKETAKLSVFKEFDNQMHIQDITDISTLTIIVFIFLILFMVGLEMILVPLKIDGIIVSSWSSVFVPLWIVMFILLCGLPSWITWEICTKTNLDKKTISTSVDVITEEFSKATTKNKNDPERYQRAYYSFVACPWCFTIPLFVALVVLAATLDGANIPYVVSCALFAFCEFVIGGLYLMIVIPYTLAHNVWDV